MLFKVVAKPEANVSWLYVDDGLIISKKMETIDRILTEFNTKFNITIIKDLDYFVSMEIKRHKEKLSICQTSYINRLL